MTGSGGAKSRRRWDMRMIDLAPTADLGLDVTTSSAFIPYIYLVENGPTPCDRMPD